MKKVVLKLEYADEKIKQKVMKKVSGLSGVESIAMDPKDKKLTVTGDIDPVSVVDKLRKLCGSKIVSVGPAKEPEKIKEKPKPKEKPKVAEDKEIDYMAEYLKAYAEYRKQQQQQYYHHYGTPMHYSLPSEPTYYGQSVEEKSNFCVIC